MKQLISMTSTLDKKSPANKPRYFYEFTVNAEPGEQFFEMVTYFLEKCPDWVRSNIHLAVKFDTEHDADNCPTCRPQS